MLSGRRRALRPTHAILERFVRLTLETHDEHVSLWGAAMLVTDRIGESALTLGRLDIGQDRFETVLGIIDQLVAVDPDHERLRSRARKRLASCAFRRGEFEEAAALCDQARVLETVHIDRMPGSSTA